MPSKKKKLIIAIDGPAGSGKSTTTQMLAKRLKIPYIDTGAMYRSITLKAIQTGVPFTDLKKLVALAKKCKITFREGKIQQVYLDGKNVTKAIRTPELTKEVYHVAQEPLIRREMVKKQRALGAKAGGVLEGRDIGTVVFPNADYKFYLEASIEVRAKRRWRELVKAGKKVSLASVIKDQKRRDATDYNRKEGPLRRAKDAILIDTSALTIPATVVKILAYLNR